MPEADLFSPVTVQIQGLRVQFSSDLAALNAFTRTHFDKREQETAAQRQKEPADIEAHVQWTEGASPRATYTPLPPGWTRLDRDINIGGEKLAWTHIDDFKEFQLHFDLEENRLRLQGLYSFSLSLDPRRNRLKKALYWRRLVTLREKRFSTILYYTMYYPAFGRLERRGLFPLHAAAVDLGGKGVVLCGLPGCGKSTLSLALLALPEARLLSDNIIFFDREQVFRCPEPVLVDDRSLQLIGEANSLLQGLGRHHVYGRVWCHLPAHRLVDQTVPRLWLFVGIGTQSRLRPLSFPEALQRFTAVNQIALEMRRYLVYRAVLGHLSPPPPSPGYDDAVILRRLYDQGQCYELTMGWDQDLHNVIDQVCTLMETVRS